MVVEQLENVARIVAPLMGGRYVEQAHLFGSRHVARVAAAREISRATGFDLSADELEGDARIHLHHFVRDPEGNFSKPSVDFFPPLIDGPNGRMASVYDFEREQRQQRRHQ